MGGCASSPVPSAGVSSFYELQALDIDKQPVEFARFKGQASGGPLLLQGRQAGRYPTPPPPPPPPSRRSTHHLPLPFRRSCSSATPHQSEAATAMHTSRWGPQPHWPHRMAWHRAAPRHAAPTPANPAQHSPRSTPASTPTAANPAFLPPCLPYPLQDFNLLAREYASRGLIIVAFPCNQFFKQEPGSNEAIKAFMAARRFRCGAGPAATAVACRLHVACTALSQPWCYIAAARSCWGLWAWVVRQDALLLLLVPLLLILLPLLLPLLLQRRGDGQGGCEWQECQPCVQIPESRHRQPRPHPFQVSQSKAGALCADPASVGHIAGACSELETCVWGDSSRPAHRPARFQHPSCTHHASLPPSHIWPGLQLH